MRPEGPASNLGHIWSLVVSLPQRLGKPIDITPAFSPLLTPTVKPGYLYLRKSNLYTFLVFQLLRLLANTVCIQNHLALVGNRVCIHKFPRTVTKKEVVFQWAQGNLSPAQREQVKMPTSVGPWKGLYSFPIWWLRVSLLIHLHLGTNCNPLLRDADGSWHTLNSWKPLEQRSQTGKSQRFERQSGATYTSIEDIFHFHSIDIDCSRRKNYTVHEGKVSQIGLYSNQYILVS